MKDKALSKYLTPESALILGLLCLVVGMPLSKFLLSISPGIIGAAALWHLIQHKGKNHLKAQPYAWLLASLFFMLVLSGLYTENLDVWIKDLKEKVILAGLPLAIAILPALSKKQYLLVYYCFILAISLTALLSLYFYVLDYESVTEAIGKNKAVDIVGRMHHSYFGLLQAFSILLAVDLGRRKMQLISPAEPQLLYLFAAINFLTIHLFASRTGLACLYVGTFAYLIFNLFTSSNKKLAVLILLGMLALPVVSYYAIPGFKNRVDVTHWDLQQYFIEDRDLSEKSFSQRLLVWKSSWNIFQSSPIIGIGLSDVEDELKRRAEEDQNRINQEFLLKSPHNQYLEYLAAYGLVGFLLLLCNCIFPLLYIRPGIAVFYAFVSMWMTAMMFESILERVVGISFVCTFLITLPLFYQTNKS